MITHDLVQRSPEWRRYRLEHWNASDAPAMMSVSTNKTRSQLLQELHTGLEREFSDYVQERVIDPGYAFEAQARTLAEMIVGESLYPVTGSAGRFSASFDGLTMGEDVVWEHKRLNATLRDCLPPDGVPFDGDVQLPPMYCIQLEQQLMVSGAGRALFMASEWADDGTLIEARHCWYAPDLALRSQIVAGWAQLEVDLAAYEPPQAAAVVVAAAVTALPAVSVQVAGAITIRDNFKPFEVALRDFIDNQLIREPSTDQDFADLDLQIKALKNAEAALDAAETQMLSQVEAVDAAKRTKDMLLKLARDNRLMAEKLLAARKEQIKGEIVAGGIADFAAHVQEMRCPYLPRIAADFAGAAKNKRTVASLQDAVDTELARVKIEANGHYQRIQQNLATIEQHAGYRFLFADVGTLALKAPDDLALVIRSRIADHEAKEGQRLEAERHRIRVEEQAKAQREADARAAETLRLEREAQAERDRVAARGKAATDAAEAARQAVEVAKQADELDRIAQRGKYAPALAGIIDRGESPAGKALVNAMAPPPAPRVDEPATLNLGAINARFGRGFTVTAAFLAETLHIQHAATDKAAKLYRESQWPLICAALARHAAFVSELQAA